MSVPSVQTLGTAQPRPTQFPTGWVWAGPYPRTRLRCMIDSRNFKANTVFSGNDKIGGE